MIQIHDAQVGATYALIVATEDTTALSVYLSNAPATGVSLSTAPIANTVFSTVSFTSQTSGVFWLTNATKVLASIEVVAKPLRTMLQNIEDEALGSWSWDKVSGSLVLLKQDGSSLASFTVVDTQTVSSRERTL